MIPALIHALFFALAVQVGCLVLSLGVRGAARHFGLAAEPPSARKMVLAWAAAAGLGMAAQLLFHTVHGGFGLAFPLARCISWTLTGTAIAWATSLVTPYMPVRRALAVGAGAGLAAALAFNGVLGLAGDMPGRIAAAIAYCGLLPLAVLLPLPEPAAETPLSEPARLCPCGMPLQNCPRHGEWGPREREAREWGTPEGFRSHIGIARAPAPRRRPVPGRQPK